MEFNIRLLPLLCLLHLLCVSCNANLCMNCTQSQKSDFLLLEYNKGFFFMSSNNCVCRVGMDLVQQECVTIPLNSTYDAVLLAVPDPSVNKLILCGTGQTGVCEMKNFNNLCDSFERFSVKGGRTALTTTSVAGPLGGNTVAFSSWGMNGDNNETVLYTAASARRDNVFSTLSVRSLKSDKKFQLLKQQGFGSRIELVDDPKIQQLYKDRFHPVGGFSYQGIAYFLSNQIKTATNDSGAKLIRLCQNDEGRDYLLSYMDIGIECGNRKNLTHAMLMSAGEVFRTFKTAKTGETDVVVAVFDGLRVCLYTFEKILEDFTRFQTLTNASLRYLKPSDTSGCSRRSRSDICGNLSPQCRNSISMPEIHVSRDLVLSVTHPINVMATASINGGIHSLFVTASNAISNSTLAMYYIGGASTPEAIQIRNSAFPENVRGLKIIDDTVYVLTPTWLKKWSLYNNSECSKHTDYFECVKQIDPFCGWCRQTKMCSIRRKCDDKSKWLPITNNPLPVGTISGISSKIGPLSGGSHITLTGQGLDLYDEITVIIGDERCINTDIPTRNSSVMTCLTPPRSQPEVVNVTYTIHGSGPDETYIAAFSYLEDPTVSGISPNRSFASGGRNLTIVGTNFNVIQEPRIQIVNTNISEECDHTTNNSVLVCRAPEASQEVMEELEGLDPKRSTDGEGCANRDIVCAQVEFLMDGVNSSLYRLTVGYTRDPEFYNFTEPERTKTYISGSGSLVVILGNRLNLSASQSDFHVTVGKVPCDVLGSKIFRTEVHCFPPQQIEKNVWNTSIQPVQVRLGNIYSKVGFLHYIPPEEEHYIYLYIVLSLLVAIVIGLIILGVLLRRRSRLAVQKMQTDMEQMEMRIQAEFRQAFADLQTDMTDITGELVETGLPYNRFPVYAFQILFPADDATLMTSHKAFIYPETSIDVTDLDTAMSELDSLFSNKFFVLSVVNTLDQQKQMSMTEKGAFAGYMAAGMMEDISFFSQLTKSLLEQYVEDVVSKKKHKTLFRRYESITEKLTGMWLCICLHQHLLQHRGGSALIMLVKAMQIVMEKSPIDAVTDAARATLSYDQLLLSQVDNDKTIKLKVQINDGAFECMCPVLECDTIAQVKSKCLGFMYKKDPASLRPTKDDVDLQWHCGKQGRLILQEEDTVPADDNHVKLMTLADYHVTDGSVMELLNRKINDEEEEYVNFENQQNQLSQSDVYLLIEDEEEEKMEEETNKDSDDTETIKYHLVEPKEECLKTKILPEAHLNKLLQMKMNIKQFVDEAIDSALDKKDIPVVVKYMFSVLETLATSLGVDQDTLMSWKNNSYPIRFWGLLLSRPRIVFDIDTPDYLQPSLDIVASTFIDSFSPPQTLSKNSAPHKLLFFKDLEEYRSMVKSFHRGVGNVPAVGERELKEEMHKLTYTQSFTVNRTSVYYELYRVIVQYKKEILEGLEEDTDASRLDLSKKLEHVLELMDS